MSTSVSSWAVSGHIDLDHQRSRAKRLLKRLQDGSAPSELARLMAGRRREVRPPRLADAQWLIARELGFASWPRLKAHADAIRFAAAHPAFAADDEPNAGHWRCGNDIARSLRTAGFRGEFRMFADPLCMGPVPADEDERIAIRSRYLSEIFDIPLAESRRRLEDEYRGLDRLATSARNVLWCEADAYDQLFLIAALARLDRVPERLELIEVDRIPGVRRFIGIGQLAPEVLAWLWPQRRPVGADALRLARAAWQAYCSPSPEAWADLARTDHPALPFLAPALRRQLQELPSLADGLSLTERLALMIVADRGRIELGRVFAELHGEREPLPFLGDSMFNAMMRPLIEAAEPLLREWSADLDWPRRPVALTPLGERVLAGRACWRDHASADRWVGGVRLEPRRPHWALDEAQRPVRQLFSPAGRR